MHTFPTTLIRFAALSALGALLGCKSLDLATAPPSTEIAAIVKGTEELEVLSRGAGHMMFVTTLEIRSPAQLQGRTIAFREETPLPAEHPFRQEGTTAEFTVLGLTAHEGSNPRGDGGESKIIYFLDADDVHNPRSRAANREPGA